MTTQDTNATDTFKHIKTAYDCCRVGQSVYVSTVGGDGRVIAVGRKYIRVMAASGRILEKVTGQDVIDWWR